MPADVIEITSNMLLEVAVDTYVISVTLSC
jgi:hypothetical protein